MKAMVRDQRRGHFSEVKYFFDASLCEGSVAIVQLRWKVSAKKRPSARKLERLAEDGQLMKVIVLSWNCRRVEDYSVESLISRIKRSHRSG